MFGHQDNLNDNGQANDAVQHGSNASADSSVSSLGPDTVAPTASSSSHSIDDAISSYVAAELPSTPEHTTPPPASPPVIPHPADPSGAPQTTPPPIELPPAPTTTSSSAASSPSTPTTSIEAGDLLSLKQSALHELSPLLGQLDQTPEERFRTMMMMIQASDDHTMLQAAYDAAKSIHDEKIRAQALLDIVNEINYFTQATSDTAI